MMNIKKNLLLSLSLSVGMWCGAMTHVRGSGAAYVASQPRRIVAIVRAVPLRDGSRGSPYKASNEGELLVLGGVPTFYEMPDGSIRCAEGSDAESGASDQTLDVSGDSTGGCG